jgi:hypothetical protein
MRNAVPEKEGAFSELGTVSSEKTVSSQELVHAQEPEELLRLLIRFGFLQEDIAQGTGKDERTVRRWKDKAPGKDAAARLGEIRNVLLLLRDERILTDRGIVYWMRHANRLLEDYPPLSMIAAGGFRAALEAAKCFSDSERGFDEVIPEDVLQRLREQAEAKRRGQAQREKLEPVGS